MEPATTDTPKHQKSNKNPTNLFSLPAELCSEIFIMFATGTDDEPLTVKETVKRAATLREVCKPIAKWLLPFLCEQTLRVMHQKRAQLRRERNHPGMLLHYIDQNTDMFIGTLYNIMVKDATGPTAIQGLKLLQNKHAREEAHLAASYQTIRNMSPQVTSLLAAHVPTLSYPE